MPISPVLVRDRPALAAARDQLGGRVALVATMGALHEGHESLLRLAHGHADHVVVSIFVNPLQFGVGEDLAGYPRSLETDLSVCARADVYPDGPPSVRLHAGELGGRLEGRARPGHFDGVLTVVAVLLNLVRPDVAVFGRKDRQQLALVRAMVDGLAMGVEIVAGDTVREPDGLARSSRNALLDAAGRRQAVALVQGLRAAERAAGDGAGAAAVTDAACRVLTGAAGVVVDYCVLVDPDGLREVAPDHTGPATLLVAATVGTTRLLDNVDLVLRGGP